MLGTIRNIMNLIWNNWNINKKESNTCSDCHIYIWDLLDSPHLNIPTKGQMSPRWDPNWICPFLSLAFLDMTTLFLNMTEGMEQATLYIQNVLSVRIRSISWSKDCLKVCTTLHSIIWDKSPRATAYQTWQSCTMNWMPKQSWTGCNKKYIAWPQLSWEVAILSR